jgi:hypothetical protein
MPTVKPAKRFGHSVPLSGFPEPEARSLRSAMQTLVGPLQAATLVC